MMMRRNRPNRKSRFHNREGTVATEMAVCLPIMFLLFLGSIDLIRYNLLRNIVTHAAYEAARTGIVKGATIDDVKAVVGDELSKFASPLEYTITTNPEVLPTSGASGTLQITVTADVRDAGWILSDHFPGDSMSETVEIEFE